MWIARPFQRKGIASKCTKKIIDYAFSNWDLRRIYGRIMATNVKTISGVKKMGFNLEATIEKAFYVDGEYQDELIFGYINPNV